MEDKNGQNQKKPMTDEERLELAKKLDKDLDDFINGLEKKPYKDGWPEDRWEEEMEKHPFFMKNPPQPGDELHPLYEGLQQLKYDPDENTPEELAASYKEDGNFNYKHKNYRLAILSYTEGIKVGCKDLNMQTSLLNNRSTANFYLKNFRSSLRDCEQVLKMNPSYMKAKLRAANCCFMLEEFDYCIDLCDIILENDATNKHIQKLRHDGVIANKNKERDLRKRQACVNKRIKEEESLLQVIISRNINIIRSSNETLSLENFQEHFPAEAESKVHLDNQNNLLWPVVFLYPEYETMDLIQEFPENNVFVDHLNEVFSNSPAWDHEKKYIVNNLSVYFENSKMNKIYAIDVRQTLKEILQHEKYLLVAGTPSFFILPKDSSVEKIFLQRY